MTTPMFLCGVGGAPDDALRSLSTLISCCMGAATDGPTACTCWVVEYDLDQQPVDTTTEPATRDKMCEDCAYRPSSPERQGDERYVAPPADTTAVFWCHQGMRKPLRFRHPTAGITVEASGDFYEPPIADGVPYKADGTPGSRCAGWAAQRRVDATAVQDVLEELSR